MAKRRKKKADASEKLRSCAEMLCDAALRMCNEGFGDENALPEAKALKEACSAVKEAAALYTATTEETFKGGEELIIRFDLPSEAFAE